MSLDERLNRDQDISVHGKHLNTLLTEIYKTIFEKNLFLKIIFTKKDVMYNLRKSKLLTPPKKKSYKDHLKYISKRF